MGGLRCTCAVRGGLVTNTAGHVLRAGVGLRARGPACC